MSSAEIIRLPAINRWCLSKCITLNDKSRVHSVCCTLAPRCRKWDMGEVLEIFAESGFMCIVSLSSSPRWLHTPLQFLTSKNKNWHKLYWLIFPPHRQGDVLFPFAALMHYFAFLKIRRNILDFINLFSFFLPEEPELLYVLNDIHTHTKRHALKT